MANTTYIEAITSALQEEMQRDDSVFVLGEDVGVKGGVFGATKGLMQEFGEDRVLDTPLAESAIVGVAIGASFMGLRPVAEMQYSDFMLPATNQIINEAAKIRYRSNNDWDCPIVIRAPIGAGVLGGLYHSQCPESMFFGTAGLKIVAPSTPYDAKGLLKAAIRDSDPVIYFEHKKCYRLISGDVPDEDYIVPIGKADVKRHGNDITVITYGLTVHFALQAAERLATEGISAHILDLRTIQPIDREAVLEAVKKTGKVLIAHEASKMGGVGAEISAMVSEELLFDLDAPIMRLCGPDIPGVPSNRAAEDFYMVGTDDLEQAMRKLAMF